eukprot:scaffold42458_cov66-Attheya_sp.AAC.1
MIHLSVPPLGYAKMPQSLQATLSPSKCPTLFIMPNKAAGACLWPGDSQCTDPACFLQNIVPVLPSPPANDT